VLFSENIDIPLNICYSSYNRGEKPRLPLIREADMAFKPEEKRCFPRIKIQTPLRYQIRGTPEFNNAIGDNISLNGIGFITDKFIVPSTNIMLEINLLSWALTPVGRVVWSSPLPHSDRYRLGVEFIELDPNQKNYLTDYIDMQRDEF
jgi:hypothetical protein